MVPASFLNKKSLVLFFYFSNKTYSCTAEAKYFRDFYQLFTACGAEVIGVSLDGAESQSKFSNRLRLPFPLISDKPGGLHRIFSKFPLDQIVRRTYVVDKQGCLVSFASFSFSFSDVLFFSLSRSTGTRPPYCRKGRASPTSRERSQKCRS